MALGAKTKTHFNYGTNKSIFWLTFSIQIYRFSKYRFEFFSMSILVHENAYFNMSAI